MSNRKKRVLFNRFLSLKKEDGLLQANLLDKREREISKG